MIKSVELINFQAHPKTFIEFTEGLNIFIGQSDSGKTAILRALKWAFYNKPSGDNFRRLGTKETKITVVFTDETILIRQKTASKNIYQLNDTVFKAFGQDVPLEIQKYLNLSVENIQQQLDTPFLLNETPGKVASYFNKVAHLEDIDNSISYLNHNENKVKAIKKVNEFIIEDKTKELSKYNFLEDFKYQLACSRDQENGINKIKDSQNLILDFISKDQKLNVRITKLKNILNLEKSVLKALRILSKIEGKKDQITDLENLVSLHNTAAENIKGYTNIISVEPKVNEILKIGVDYNETRDNYISLKRSLKLNNAFRYKIVELNNTLFIEKQVNICLATIELQKVDLNVFKELGKAIKNIQDVNFEIQSKKENIQKDQNLLTENIGNICPLCDSQLNTK